MNVPLIVRLEQVDDSRLFRLVHNPIQHPEKWENIMQSCGLRLAYPKFVCVRKYSLLLDARRRKVNMRMHS
jgi:hypothetical protein